MTGPGVPEEKPGQCGADAEEADFSRLLQLAGDAGTSMDTLREAAGMPGRTAGPGGEKTPETATGGAGAETGATKESFMDAEGNPVWISISVPEPEQTGEQYSGHDAGAGAGDRLFPRRERIRAGRFWVKRAARAGKDAGKDTPRGPGLLRILIWGLAAGAAILVVRGQGCSAVKSFFN